MKYRIPRIVAALGIALLTTFATRSTVADISQFNEWTLVEDPAHDYLKGSISDDNKVTLSALDGPIDAGTDIGYQTVNGQDVGTSSQGWAFRQNADFSVSIDYNLAFNNPTGGFSIGFGMGEDRDGSNSAGVVLGSRSGILLGYAGAARINDVDQNPLDLGISGTSSGRFLLSYAADTGDITLGVSIDLDDIAEGTATFSGIQNSWNDKDLLVSFFARTEAMGAKWFDGEADAVFSNFRVLEGQSFAVPEPSSLALALLGCFGVGVLVVRSRD